LQGELAGTYGDVVVITEEDDRDINGQQIMNEIAAGAEVSGKVPGKDLFLVHDRTEAIRFAINRANKGDIERADGEHPWDEIGTAHAALKSK